MKKELRQTRRASRSRFKAKKVNKTLRPRLSVFRSGRQIYAQVIDDVKGVTVASASTLEGSVKDKVKNTANSDAATYVGKVVAERAKKAGVEAVYFDRGSYLFHGRVKALAEGAREGGLQF